MVCKHLKLTDNDICAGALQCEAQCLIWGRTKSKTEVDMCPKHKLEITPECWKVENDNN